MPKLIKKTYTEKNNLIKLYSAENPGDKKNETVLIIGVFHGDEPEGEDLINKLIQEIEIATSHPEGAPSNDKTRHSEEQSDVRILNRILFIPCLNPDGKELKNRTNANGVDLNRNFPTKNWKLSAEKDSYYSGISPASEIETKFLIEIIEEYKPDRILTLHTPYRVVNYDGSAKEIAEEISKLNGYPVQDNIGYPTPGSFGTYCGIERNIPTITLELPENESIDKLWDDNKEAFYYFVSL
jgi:protein MpaA